MIPFIFNNTAFRILIIGCVVFSCIFVIHSASATIIINSTVVFGTNGSNIIVNGTGNPKTFDSISTGPLGFKTRYLSTDQYHTFNFTSKTVPHFNTTLTLLNSNESDFTVNSPHGNDVKSSTQGPVLFQVLVSGAPVFFNYYGGLNTFTVNSATSIKEFFSGNVPVIFPPNPPASASSPGNSPVSYNQSSINIPWVQVPRAGRSDVFVEPNINNNTITSWYFGNTTSNKLTLVIGTGLTPLTLSCTPTIPTFEANDSNIYYVCPVSATAVKLEHINIGTGTTTHDFTATPSGNPIDADKLFLTQKSPAVWLYSLAAGHVLTETTKSGNTTQGDPPVSATGISVSNENFVWSGAVSHLIRYNFNSTASIPSTANPCEMLYAPNNSTVKIDDIVCDTSIPANVLRYWNGISMNKIGNFYTNSTLPLFSSVNLNSHKKALTLTGGELGVTEPFTDFILHSNIDYMVVVTASNIYYAPISVVESQISSHTNRAIQSYMTTVTGTDQNYQIPTSNPVTPMINYGTNLNVTISKFGMYTLASGYFMKESSILSAVRPLDPRWTNSIQDYPAIATGGSGLFPIILTVNNAPSNSALMLSSSSQVISGVAGTWCVTQMDSTHTAECDIPAGQCPNVFVADISTAPSIWNPEGSICATGTNLKSITYLSSLPLTFWSYTYGASHTYSATTNILTTTVRSTVTPFNYTVIVKNSTGQVAITQSFAPAGGLDTQSFNVAGIAKPAALYIDASNAQTQPTTSQIYSAYLGSPLSLASTASFFHQYLSYQGFDFLSLIPLVFASMFTRNTVGIGGALTVVLIATLSWLSLVPIPDLYIYISIIIACVAIVGYRGLYG